MNTHVRSVPQLYTWVHTIQVAGDGWYDAAHVRELLQPAVRLYNAPAHAAKATMINPGMTRRANESPPLEAASTILRIVLVDSAARIGKIASEGLVLPDATSEATEIAAECVSAKPAMAAAKITPFSPNPSRSAAQATRMMERVNANTKAVERLNARPLCTSASALSRNARAVNAAP